MTRIAVALPGIATSEATLRSACALNNARNPVTGKAAHRDAQKLIRFARSARHSTRDDCNPAGETRLR
jgi:hypothetical protein